VFQIRIFISFLLVLLLFSCNYDPQVEIKRYHCSDSICELPDSHSPKMNFDSDVEICLLSCPSGNAEHTKIVNSINRSILELIAPDYVNEEYDSISKRLVHANIEEMREINSNRFSSLLYDDTEECDEDSITYNFYNNISTDCRIGLGDSIICYTYNLSSYISGAHPNNVSYAYSYSLINGNKIHPNLLFSKEGKSKMLDRIIAKLIKREKVKNEEELRALGFEVLQLTDNILLDKDSITFHYDSYTIAPFSYGEFIDIKFSYSEISDIFLWTNPEK